MENLYLNSIDICHALATGAKQGVRELRHSDAHANGRILGSLGLFTAAAGVAAAASYSDHHRKLNNGSRLAASSASALLLLAGILTSQTLVSAIFQPAARAVSQALDQQWLKAHPINYA